MVKLDFQDKWEVGKCLIKSLKESLDSDIEHTIFNFKELERIRGFLAHLSMTYEIFAHPL